MTPKTTIGTTVFREEINNILVPKIDLLITRIIMMVFVFIAVAVDNNVDMFHVITSVHIWFWPNTNSFEAS